MTLIMPMSDEFRSYDHSDPNCISRWLPPLAAAGLPVPKTEIIRAEDNVNCDWLEHYEKHIAEAERLRLQIVSAIDMIGGPGPWFLRTGHTSGKHDWKKTCHLPGRGDVLSHVFALVEYAEMTSMGFLSCQVWAVREMLPTDPVLTLPMYGDFPLVKEFRCFVRGPEVVCVHAYWPREAVECGFPFVTKVRVKSPGEVAEPDVWGFAEEDPRRELPDDFELTYADLCHLPDGMLSEVESLASAAGAALLPLGPAWSVDVLQTRRGWFVTDCAVARDSYHWDGCEKADLFS